MTQHIEVCLNDRASAKCFEQNDEGDDDDHFKIFAERRHLYDTVDAMRDQGETAKFPA